MAELTRGRAGFCAALLVACALLVSAQAASAAEPSDGIAQTPPLSWNSWYAFGDAADEDLVKETADAFVATGLRDAGYEYLILDTGWALLERDSNGRLVPDPEKFPSGMKALGDYLHSKGLKLGIYGDSGSEGCGAFVGNLGHEVIDAQTLAEWGVDYLKYDNCGEHLPFPETRAGYEARYSVMSDALQATGRDIVLDLAEWGVSSPWEWGDRVGHLWSTDHNLDDSWAAVKRVIEQNATLDQYAHPGAWNNPDHLLVGVDSGQGPGRGLNHTEERTHFGLWAIMAAPLTISADVRNVSPETMEIFLNRDLLAVNQDRLGVQARVVQEAWTTQHGKQPMGVPEVFSKPLHNGDVAVALYNAGDSPRTIETTAARVGLSPKASRYVLKDLWTDAKRSSVGRISARVPSHGTVVYRIKARVMGSNGGKGIEPSTTLSVAHRPLPDRRRPPAVERGEALIVTTTVENDGDAEIRDLRLEADEPAGWSISPRGTTRRERLGSRSKLVTTWVVRAPSDAELGAHSLEFVGTYEWGGDSQEVREGLDVYVQEPPPAGTTALSDLDWFMPQSYHAPIVKDGNVRSRNAGDPNVPPGDPNRIPIAMNGVEYPKGLGVHAPAYISYYVGKQCKSLTVDVGIDDSLPPAGTLLWGWIKLDGHVIFRIRADGKTVAESDVKIADQAPTRLRADISGATWIELEADDAGDTSTPDIFGDHGYWWDKADWGGPELTCR